MARRKIPLVPLIAGMVASATATGVVAWWLNLQGLEGRVAQTRSALKKLVLSGRIPPNQEVMDHLTSRQTSLDANYQRWVKAVAAPPVADAAKADPQLYFQQQFHEVQQTLERLAAARQLAVPEQLGFPKELPPSDTVPRLLAQLSLIEEVATLIFDHRATALSAVKVEDPESVADEEGRGPFLMRLPVRVRMTGSLATVMTILGAMERVRPLIDVRALTLASQPDSERLDVELVLCRYLVMAAAPEAPPADADEQSPADEQRPKNARRTRRGATDRVSPPPRGASDKGSDPIRPDAS